MKTMNKLVAVGVVLAAALAMVGCEKVENAGRKAALRHPGRLSGGRSSGEGQVEPREDPRRQMVKVGCHAACTLSAAGVDHMVLCLCDLPGYTGL